MADLTSLVASGLTTGMIWGGTILIVVLVLGGIWWYKKIQKQYDCTCIVYDKQPNGTIICSTDIGGVFRDPMSDTVSFRLKKNNTVMTTKGKGINTYWFPYIITSTGKKLVSLLKTGVKSFRFIEVDLKTNSVYMTITDEDLEWARTDFNRNAKLYGTSTWKELLPYVMFIVCAIMIIVMLSVVVKKFDVLVELSNNLNVLAETVRQTTTGTTVIQ